MQAGRQVLWEALMQRRRHRAAADAPRPSPCRYHAGAARRAVSIHGGAEGGAMEGQGAQRAEVMGQVGWCHGIFMRRGCAGRSGSAGGGAAAMWGQRRLRCCGSAGGRRAGKGASQVHGLRGRHRAGRSTAEAAAGGVHHRDKRPRRVALAPKRVLAVLDADAAAVGRRQDGPLLRLVHRHRRGDVGKLCTVRRPVGGRPR